MMGIAGFFIPTIMSIEQNENAKAAVSKQQPPEIA